MSTLRKLGALVAAGALVLALTGTAMAANAVPVGHYASQASDGSNEGAFWVTYLNANFAADLSTGDCVKLSNEAFDAVNNGDGTADLGVAYGWVIVKQASASAVLFDNTIFKDVSAAQSVYADTNGNFSSDEGDSQGISHIIVCDPNETTTTTTEETTTEETTTEETTTTTTEETTTTTTFTQETSGETDVPTEPPTSTFGGGTSGPSDGSWLLVLALGIFLASVVILTPAGAKSRN